MGLKNKLSKMKNFLFDEEEEREEKKEVKKEKKHKHEVIEEPTFEEEKTIKTSVIEDDDYTYNFDNDFDEVVKRENDDFSRVEKQEFTIPELTDDDFLFPQEEPRNIEPVVEQPLLYQASKKRKDEVRRFKPSPNISPVYGLLDENGNKISDDKDTVEKALNNKDEVSLDDVRKKAYGKLDDTLDTLSSKTIEEAEKEQKEIEEKEEISREKKTKKKKEVEEKEEVKEEVVEETTGEPDEDEMILPSVSFKEINVDEETKEEKEKVEEDKKDEDDDDEETKEQDLFNLIETMHSKEEEE